MKYKKLLCVALTAVMTLGCISGCGANKGDSEEGDSANDPNAVELSVGFLQTNSETANIQKLVREFEAEQKEKGSPVKVKLVGIQSSDYNKQILQMASVETLPDVVYTYDDYASQWAAKGVFENLDSYFEKDIDMSLYDDVAFEPARVYENSLYFAPREYNHPVVFVNTETFEKYGIEYKQYQNGWTWSQFMDTLKKLREEMNKDKLSDYLYPLDGNLHWAPIYNAWIRSFGGYVFNPEDNSVGLSEPGTIKAITEIKTMVDNKLVTDPRGASGGGTFSSGNAAMSLQVRPSVSSAVEAGIKLAFLPMPTMESGTTYLSYGSSGFAMSATSEKKELAWEFLKFIMGEKGQEIFSSTGNGIPILKAMQTDENAAWRKSLEGVNQDAFIISESQKDTYTRILTVYARGYDPDKERGIYTKAGSLIGELYNKSVQEWADYATAGLKGVL